jgi:hypothetical protein
MFRHLVSANLDSPNSLNQDSIFIDRQKAEHLFRMHPSELSALLELAWEFRLWENDPSGNHPLGHPNRRSDISQLPEYLLNNLLTG